MDFYRSPSPMTELPRRAFADVSGDLDELRLQGLLLHCEWAGAYGVLGSVEERNLRSAEVLERATEISAEPTTADASRRRVAGICWHSRHCAF